MLQYGHYTLPVPFKKENPDLPNNRAVAHRRLATLGKKLRRDPMLKDSYTRGMSDLLTKGYATMRADGKVWYLPHHPVINPNKDKPRIVDCATKRNDEQAKHFKKDIIGIKKEGRVPTNSPIAKL